MYFSKNKKQAENGNGVKMLLSVLNLKSTFYNCQRTSLIFFLIFKATGQKNKTFIATLQTFMEPGIILHDFKNLDQESQVHLEAMIHYSDSRNICEEKPFQILFAKIHIEELFKVIDIWSFKLIKIWACLNHGYLFNGVLHILYKLLI